MVKTIDQNLIPFFRDSRIFKNRPASKPTALSLNVQWTERTFHNRPVNAQNIPYWSKTGKTAHNPSTAFHNHPINLLGSAHPYVPISGGLGTPERSRHRDGHVTAVAG